MPTTASTTRPCNALCTTVYAIGGGLSLAGLAALGAYAVSVRGPDGKDDLGTVLDASVIVTSIICTTVALLVFARLVTPVWRGQQVVRRQLDAVAWELQVTRRDPLTA